MRKMFKPFVSSIRDWKSVRSDTHAAAIAYYGIFALAPLLLFIVVIAGFVLSPAEARVNALNVVGDYVGPEVSSMLGTLMDQVAITGSNIFFLIIAFILTFLGAMRVFTAMREAFYTIWKLDSSKGGFRHIVSTTTKGTILIFFAGILLLLSVVLSTVIAAFRGSVPDVGMLDDLLFTAGEFLLSLFVPFFLSIGFLLVLPPKRPKLTIVLIPALLLTVLTFLMKYAFAFYISVGTTTSAYGAASTLVVFLLWIYFMSMLMLFGAKLTYEYEKLV